MSNSPEAIKNFPFPFVSDSYMYSVNIQPVVNEALFDVNEHYHNEIEERDRILKAGKPGRYFAFPHMKIAQWDALEIIMNDLVAYYPESFTLTEGDRWNWENKKLSLKDTFTFLDESTLPCEPFEYISRQVQEDIILLDQREDDLFLDAGILR